MAKIVLAKSAALVDKLVYKIGVSRMDIYLFYFSDPCGTRKVGATPVQCSNSDSLVSSFDLSEMEKKSKILIETGIHHQTNPT